MKKRIYTGLTGILLIVLSQSCFKPYYYRFTEAEEAFFPYHSKDSLYIIWDQDTALLKVFEYDEYELRKPNSRQYYEVKRLSFTDDLYQFSIFCSQEKRDNIFEASAVMGLGNDMGSFHYSEQGAPTIKEYEGLTLNNRNYSDVIEIRDTLYNTILYLNPDGFILVETDIDTFHYQHSINEF